MASKVPAAEMLLLTEVVSLERVQRRRGGLLDGGRELLDRGERLAQLLAQPGRRLAEPDENPFAALRLGLLARDGLTAGRAHGLQVDHVVAAEARNRPKQQRLDALALRDLAREIPRHALVRRSSDVAKRLADACLGHDVEVRALPQFNRHGLLERAVEDFVAGGIDEVGDQDAVLVREGRGATGRTGARKVHRDRGSDGHDDGEGEEASVRPRPARGRSGFSALF